MNLRHYFLARPRLSAARRPAAWLGLAGLLALSALPVELTHAATPSAAFRKQCEERLPEPRVVVRSHPSDIRYDFRRSVHELTQAGRIYATETRTDHVRTLGLTESQFRIQRKTAMTTLTDPRTGVTCLSPDIEIDLSVGPQTVSIGREFPQGSCAFNEIASHELRHVEVNQAYLEAAADLLDAGLRAELGRSLLYGDKDTLAADIERALAKQWVPQAQAAFAKARAAHARIDSPEEYARNNTVCDGEIPRRLRGHR